MPTKPVVCEDIFGGVPVLGAFDPSRSLVVLNPALGDAAMTQAEWTRTITHELVHAFDHCRVEVGRKGICLALGEPNKRHTLPPPPSLPSWTRPTAATSRARKSAPRTCLGTATSAWTSCGVGSLHRVRPGWLRTSSDASAGEPSSH